MKYTVIGAYRATGQPVALTIDVADSRAAEQWAQQNGIACTRIDPAEAAAAAVPASGPFQPGYAVAQPPYAAPPQQPVAYMQQTILPERKGVNGLGVAALVLGIVAIVFAWIPFCGMATLPIAVIGLVLGLVGLIIALAGQRSSASMPIAGSVVCGVSIVLAIIITGSATKAIVTAANQAANQAASQQAIAAAVSWTPADQAVTQGNVEVRVVSATVGKVKLHGAAAGEAFDSPDIQLAVTVQVRNTGPATNVEYRTWGGRDGAVEREQVTLRDDLENTCKRLTYGLLKAPVGSVVYESIAPGQAITDVLVFDPPAQTARYLNLELPSERFGGSGFVRFRIPSEMIRR